VYDKNGKPITAENHGGVGGSRAAEVSSNILTLLSLPTT